MKRAPCLIGLYLVIVSAFAETSTESWSAFLGNPNQDNYQLLAAKLQSCVDSTCDPSVEPTADAMSGLIALVRQGDPHALSLGLMCRRILSGGPLEDLTRAIASTVDTEPKVFLEQAKATRLGSRELRVIVRMLPAAVIDNDKARRDARQIRIQSLKSVSDTDLASIRNVAISDLND